MEEKNHNWVTWVLGIIVLLLIVFIVYEAFHKSTPAGNVTDIATSTSNTQSTPDTVPANWKTYVNSEFKYQFRFPETITFSKDLTTSAPDGNSSITYHANSPINIQVEDVSKTAGYPARSRIQVVPLYVEINAVLKPSGYSTLSKYVADQVDIATKQGENSAAGVYAESSPTSINGKSGYLVVVSDGSVIKNRDDKYYFDYGSYIYTFDMAYSGYYYETKDPDEVTRVDAAKGILSSFRFIN